jgi:excisionase family DNA binding protein
MSEEDTISTSEAAALLNVSKSTVRRLADKGVLESFRTSPSTGHRRFLKEKVLAYRDTVYPDDNITF